ncbi:transporter [Homoserinibacter sp. YIM 151385]|uniref:transporter n=1 Tax=Homoserinibacter sp. YIM 151385 TaxID=2985506 RepID=UPI0022F0A766|nr:transporter [Homoserinibacter sp. YIM 151385]WBU38422.1 transporter [Homoserinibacter sp. YIM 151385]
MVATLLRLRFLLLRNQLAKHPWQIVAVVLGGLYGLGVLAGVVAILIGLSAAPIELARTVAVLGGSAVVLGWTVLPALTSGIDQTVDPARLAPFPVPLDRLLLALAVSGILGIPGAVTLLASAATALTWWRQPGIAVVALLCGALATVTAVLGSRMLVALASRIAIGRRGREARSTLVLIPLVLLGPIIVVLTGWIREIEDVLPRIAEVLAWTPFGALWAIPSDLAAGQPGRAAAGLAIGLAWLALVIVLWRWGLARALEQPPQEARSGAGREGLGLLGRLPGTPAGAVAARALIYWIRDPRYAQSLVSVPLVPIFVFVYSGFGDDLTPLVWVSPIVAVLLAMSIYTDVSYDSSAFALHLQTGLRGVDDRLGRVLALAAFAVPVTLLLAVGSVALSGSWWMLPGLLGIVTGILLSGFGISSIVSATWVFSVPAPGESPFRSKPGAGFSLMLSTFGTWASVALATLPEVVLAIVGFATGSVVLGWISLLVGLVLGAVVLVLGIRLGGRILDARAPELLTRLRLEH